MEILELGLKEPLSEANKRQLLYYEVEHTFWPPDQMKNLDAVF